jgi:hypothetical protein
MALLITKRQLFRAAFNAIHNPPNATDQVKASKNNQMEKNKMVKELTPFLMYLYKKYMDAKVTESVGNFITLVIEDINIPISVGDTILGGKFKNKRIVVKSIGKNEKGDITINGKPLLKYRILDESTLSEFGGVRFDAIGYDKNGKEVDMYLPRANTGFEKNIVHAAADKLFKSGKGVEYIEVYYDKHHLGTIKKPRTFTKGKDWGKLPINEIPMGDLQKIDQFADKQLNPVDVVLTDKHFFDRLNDPRNGKEISNAELIGFFKRLAKHKKEFVEFLEKYNSVVAVDDRTNINIPFMKQANKAIAKTVMRKKDFKTPDKKLDI